MIRLASPQLSKGSKIGFFQPEREANHAFADLCDQHQHLPVFQYLQII
ncbi:hypothetical protein [Shewanella sp. ECSMB14102]|nr:hypothetical protein [Shewanella sp. ECSMB14102]